MSKSNPRIRVMEEPSMGSVGSSMRRRLSVDCRCETESVIRTINDPRNPNFGRNFWGCRNYKNSMDKGCGFFKLIEEDVVDERDLKIEKQRKKTMQLKKELAKTQNLLKISIIFGLMCFGVCLVLGTVLLCSSS